MLEEQQGGQLGWSNMCRGSYEARPCRFKGHGWRSLNVKQRSIDVRFALRVSCDVAGTEWTRSNQ